MELRTPPVIAALAILALAASASGEDVARGKEIFRLCEQCHGPEGRGNQLFLAPAIAAQPAWYVTEQLQYFRKGERGKHPDDVGGLRMYPMSLSLKSDEDVKDVAAYVASLPAPPVHQTIEGDAAKGATYYKTCQACHGADGKGNAQIKAPRLYGTSDWYLVEALKKFKAGIRGTDPGNPTATMMRGMAMSLPDDQAIRDVVAHVLTLGN